MLCFKRSSLVSSYPIMVDGTSPPKQSYSGVLNSGLLEVRYSYHLVFRYPVPITHHLNNIVK